jgi:hypothetical protein
VGKYLISYIEDMEEEDASEEGDLELLEENTDTAFKNHLTRLRRGCENGSPTFSSRRKQGSSPPKMISSAADLPQVQIFGVIEMMGGQGAAGDEEDMDGFIDYEEEEGAGVMDEREREERCTREREKLECQPTEESNRLSTGSYWYRRPVTFPYSPALVLGTKSTALVQLGVRR